MPSFESCLQDVLQEILLSDEDRQSFTSDAEIIRNKLMELMKEENQEFKKVFDGLSLTGSYLDKLKIDLPEEFDMDMKLKMPFKLTPRADQQRPGFVTLVAEKNYKHRFIGRKRKIVRYTLQMWLRKLFLDVIGENGIKIEANGRVYEVTYPTCGRGSGVAHTVEAKEVGGSGREISFDFVPAFEFSSKQWPLKKVKTQNEDQPWFAIPFGKTVNHSKERSNKYTFKVSAPFWERDALHDKKNLKNSLRLMKALRDENDLEKLASYTLKSVYLQELGTRKPGFWEQSIGEILIKMLKCLLNALKVGSLPFFLHLGFNQLNLLPENLMGRYETVIEEILEELQMYRDSGDVEFNDVRAIFER